MKKMKNFNIAMDVEKFGKDKLYIVLGHDVNLKIDGEKYTAHLSSKGLEVTGGLGTGNVVIDIIDLLSYAHEEILKCKKENENENSKGVEND